MKLQFVILYGRQSSFFSIQVTRLLFTLQIAFGLNFKYNYFIKEKSRSSSDIIWKPGPAFSLSVPLTVLEDNEIVVRDLWIRSNFHISSAHAWNPCTEETYLLKQPSIFFPVKGIISYFYTTPEICFPMFLNTQTVV